MRTSEETRTRMPDLAFVARLLADESRATMVQVLLDGRAWTAAELARAAGIGRPTTTAHLDRLVEAGLVEEVRQGRHRYVRIGDPRVAEAVESLAALSMTIRPAAPSYTAQRADARLAAGRTCYGHLAGALGVDVTDALRDADVVTSTWELGEIGRSWFAELGVDLSARPRRSLVRPCLDWTERRDHLAGEAADAFLVALLDRGWIERSRPRRAVVLTSAGRDRLAASGLSLRAARRAPAPPRSPAPSAG